MTYWEQECGEKSLHDTLSTLINNNDVEIIFDEKELFRSLKRHLTRKELHAFCMAQGGSDTQAIAERINTKLEDVALVIHKAERKIKQSKVTAEIFKKKEETE